MSVKTVWFRKLSLRQKLIVTSIACLMLPTIVMLYSTSSFSQQIIREQALKSAEQSLEIVQYQIHGIMEEMVEVSNRVQFNFELKSALQNRNGPLVSMSVTAQLEQLASARPDMNLTLLLADGRYYSNYSYYEFEPSSFRQQSWFRDLSRLSAYDTLYLGVQPNYLKFQAIENPYVLMTARVLMDYSSEPFAYLIVSRTENTISGIFDNFAEGIFLLDENRRILSHRDKDYIGKNFNDLITTNAVNSPGIIHLHGENQIYVSMPLGYAEWTLVSLVPYEQLTDKVNRIYQSGLLLQVLFATGFILVLVYLLRKFTKPIKVLGEVALKVESGDMWVRSNIRGGDEVGQLGRSFDHMLDRFLQMIEQVKLEQKLKGQAELAMLQAQIHPHFLFNVLSSIRLKLLMKGDDENAEMVGSLSSLLRASISTQQEFVSLFSEIEMTKQYMDLMNITMRHHVDSLIEMNSELLLETVPRFILQPIIENALNHGFSRKGGCITIRVEKNEDSLDITIKDNGHGMDAETLSLLKERLVLKKRQIIEESSSMSRKPQSGIGLSNVYDRLKIIYGDRFKMTIQSEYQEGTNILLIVPTSNMEKNEYV